MIQLKSFSPTTIEFYYDLVSLSSSLLTSSSPLAWIHTSATLSFSHLFSPPVLFSHAFSCVPSPYSSLTPTQEVKQFVSVTCRREANVTFSKIHNLPEEPESSTKSSDGNHSVESSTKSSEILVKIQNFLSAEIWRNKNVTFLFECLSNSLPFVTRIENWIRDSTVLRLRSFFETLKFFHSIPGNQAENAEFFPMCSGDVVLVPRSVVHVRVLFFSKFALDIKILNTAIVVVEGM